MPVAGLIFTIACRHKNICSIRAHDARACCMYGVHPVDGSAFYDPQHICPVNVNSVFISTRRASRARSMKWHTRAVRPQCGNVSILLARPDDGHKMGDSIGWRCDNNYERQWIMWDVNACERVSGWLGFIESAICERRLKLKTQLGNLAAMCPDASPNSGRCIDSLFPSSVRRLQPHKSGRLVSFLHKMSLDSMIASCYS